MEGNNKTEREHMNEQLAQKTRRKLNARQQKPNGVWFGLSLFGLVGWSVATPTVVGIAIGWWLDRRWPGTVSWTLTLMFVGLVLGCFNAWRWLKNEGVLRDE